ncbi:MAG: anti-sigma factor, partial [Chloroflexi bacterium]|nr:anti-sigma factor [Chloroflexota bacterium]
ELEGTVGMLSHGIEPVAPSPALKRRLMARVDADLAASQPRVSLSARFSGLLDPLRRLFASPAFSLAMVAAAIVLLWSNASLLNELSRVRTELAAAASPSSRVAVLPPATNAPKEAQARLYVSPDSPTALLVVSGLQRLGSDRTYEFWLIRGGQPEAAGTFNVDDHGAGRVLVQSDEAVTNFDQAGITVERAGGTNVPTLSALVFAGAIK